MARLLRSLRFSLRVNRKVLAPATHPRRDEQFQLIAGLRTERDAGLPIVSIDSKICAAAHIFEYAGLPDMWR